MSMLTHLEEMKIKSTLGYFVQQIRFRKIPKSDHAPC